MAKQKQTQKEEQKKTLVETRVPTRGRVFEGTVTKKFSNRVVVEFERTVFIKKYERFFRKRTRLHARLPLAFSDKVNVGDYVKVRECRPLSKIIRFVLIEKVRDADAFIKQKLAKETTDKAEKEKAREKKDKELKEEKTK
jgi:small subunit ribosomal protein S17